MSRLSETIQWYFMFLCFHSPIYSRCLDPHRFQSSRLSSCAGISCPRLDSRRRGVILRLLVLPNGLIRNPGAWCRCNFRHLVRADPYMLRSPLRFNADVRLAPILSSRPYIPGAYIHARKSGPEYAPLPLQVTESTPNLLSSLLTCQFVLSFPPILRRQDVRKA